MCWPGAADSRIPARIKVEPEDFRVDETLSFIPDGEGEHLLVKLRKRALGTPELARLLARLHGIREVDVGYAGMKDRHAVTSQWFSLRGVAALESRVAALPGVRVEELTRHTRKLRRGELAANHFSILLRGVCPEDAQEALEALRHSGAPNYFGGQRFGRHNLAEAAHWLNRRRRSRCSKFRQGLYLSTLRSFLFNEVLAARVRDGTWQSLLAGDVPDDEGGPTGPLWGRGRSPTGSEAAQVECGVLAAHRTIMEGLEHAGLNQARRSFVVRAADMTWRAEAGQLRVGFRLRPGQYATSFLREGFALSEPDRRMPDGPPPAVRPAMGMGR